MRGSAQAPCVDLSRRLEQRKLSATQFRLSMSRRDIAHHLGLTLETVSRVLGAFKREGWIDVQLRHVRLLQPEALAVLAAGCAGDTIGGRCP